jgi:hypothetical protein
MSLLVTTFNVNYRIRTTREVKELATDAKRIVPKGGTGQLLGIGRKFW